MPTKNLLQADQPEAGTQAASTGSGCGLPLAADADPARLRLLPPLSAPSSGSGVDSGLGSRGTRRTGKGDLPRRSSDDARVHRDNRPKFCPNCGEAYETRTSAAGIVVEFWTSRDRVFHCWCAACGEAFDITDANLVVTEEIEH